jgi:hypothetical protein
MECNFGRLKTFGVLETPKVNKNFEVLKTSKVIKDLRGFRNPKGH